jgi:glycosyltransferase involved in cell wall biosynthesis
MDIIYFSNTLWNGMKQRPQQICEELSKSNRVIYVEPPTFFHYLKDQKNDKIFKKPYEKELYIFNAIPTLPLKNLLSPLNLYYQRKLAVLLKNLLSELKFNDFVLWFTFPNQEPLTKYLKFGFMVYECMDEYSGLERSFGKSLFKNYELSLLKKSDLTIVTAEKLYKSKSGSSRNIILSPNAAETGFFASSLNDEIEKPKIFSNQNPVIGYIGAIREWLDVDLMEEVITKNPDLNFLFVGPVATDVEKLKRFSNVVFQGYIPYKELLPFVKLLDVAIIPFKINSLIENTNPIKIYEYLAAGKPVVATQFPEALNLVPLVSAAVREDFSQAIRDQIKNNSTIKIEKRLTFAKKNSWTERVSQILLKVNELRKN